MLSLENISGHMIFFSQTHRLYVSIACRTAKKKYMGIIRQKVGFQFLNTECKCVER